METRLNDNEVREVAKMQSLIDEYETFILALSETADIYFSPLIRFWTKGTSVPTTLGPTMHRVWDWVKGQKEKS